MVYMGVTQDLLLLLPADGKSAMVAADMMNVINIPYLV